MFNFCCLVWTLRTISCSIEIGCLFVCPILISIFLYAIDVYNSMPKFDHTLFSFKSYSTLFPLSRPWINIWSGAIYVYWSTSSALSFCEFYFVFICSLFFFLHGVWIPVFVFWCTLGNDGSVDMRDEACSNLSMLAQILDSWFQGIVVNWRN